MGKAIVSTPAGINGLHELEHDRDVVVVNTGVEMAAAIVKLIEHPERRKVLEHALLTYCERDTLAMVRVAEFFADANSGSAANPQD